MVKVNRMFAALAAVVVPSSIIIACGGPDVSGQAQTTCMEGASCTASCDGLQCKCGKLMKPVEADKVTTCPVPCESGNACTASCDKLQCKCGKLMSPVEADKISSCGSPDPKPTSTTTTTATTPPPPPPPDPVKGIVVSWTPPATYADKAPYVQKGPVTVEGEYAGYADSWKKPICTAELSGSAYVCKLPELPDGTRVTFTVKRADAKAGGIGWGYSFDRSCNPTGGCGKDFGTTVVLKDGKPLELGYVNNGIGPDYFNGVFVTVK